jgi:GYF domain 2
MATEWYCKIMGEEWGPMSAMELIAVARFGRLSRDDTVRRGAMGTWVRAELVQGLFNGSSSVPTAASSRLAVAARLAAPAKRSVRKSVSTQYWVKVGKRIAGPFSAVELRKMAEQGALNPSHWISKDRWHWARAAEAKGLSFGGAGPQAETASVRKAVSLDRPLVSPEARTASYAPLTPERAAIFAESGR